jgi:hypothetical protein
MGELAAQSARSATGAVLNRRLSLRRIGSVRQRTDLADVIAEISGFAAITGRSVATRHQVLTALAARYGGPEPAPIRPLGIGINFAAGDQRRLVLSGQDDAPPGLPPEVMREIETGGRALMEYMMARGPEPGDLPALRAYGYLCCAKIRHVALTCGSTLEVRAYPPHLSVNDPGVRLAGAPGAQ